MLKLVCFASLVFITGSIPSEARPFRNQQIAECNVSMRSCPRWWCSSVEQSRPDACPQIAL
jgi:hypothetical protein